MDKQIENKKKYFFISLSIFLIISSSCCFSNEESKSSYNLDGISIHFPTGHVGIENDISNKSTLNLINNESIYLELSFDNILFLRYLFIFLNGKISLINILGQSNSTKYSYKDSSIGTEIEVEIHDFNSVHNFFVYIYTETNKSIENKILDNDNQINGSFYIDQDFSLHITYLKNNREVYSDKLVDLSDELYIHMECHVLKTKLVE